MLFSSRLLYITLCIFISTHVYADLTISKPLPISTVDIVQGNVYVSCNTSTGEFLATWIDGSSLPTYSFYTSGTGWSAFDAIPATSPATLYRNIATSCNPVTGEFLATWADSNNYPTYSIYTPGSGWSMASTISISTTAYFNVYNTFDSTTGQFIATWADSTNNFYPTYSIYTPGTGWDAIDTITTTSTSVNIYTSLGSATGQLLAVWSDTGTGYPRYSFYTSGIWDSMPGTITSSSSVDNDVFSAYNLSTGQFIATWADINNNNYPTYSIYTPGSGWSPQGLISNTSGVNGNATIFYDLATRQFLSLWNDVSDQTPTYSFYTPGSGWGPATIISNTELSSGDIFAAYNPLPKEFVTTWANNTTTFFPIYSLFTYSSLPSEPYDPQRLKRIYTQTVDKAKAILNQSGLP